MATPDTTIHTEISVRSSVGDWTPDLIRAAERTAEGGNLRLVADLCDALLADDQVQGALATLVGALTGLDVSFEASGDRRRAKTAIRALEVGEDWWKAFPEAELVSFLTWAVLLGVAIAEIVWTEDPETGRLPGRLQVWHPRHLRWDDVARSWKLRTREGGEEITVTPGDGRWILFAPRGLRRPWKNGAWRGVARWWLLKDYAIRDWGTYSERHGTGIVVAETLPNQPVVNTDAARRKISADLRGLGTNTSIALPPGWTVRLVEATANTWQTYEKQIELANRGITVAFHGTNLTNEEGGSQTKATVLRGVHIQAIASLAGSLATTLHDSHLIYWAEFNFGERSLAPWPMWDVTPPADLLSKAQALGAIAAAVATLQTVSNRIDADAILEEYGVPLLAKPKPGALPALAQGAPPALPAAPLASPPPPGKAHDVRGRDVPAHVRGQVFADLVADDARDRGSKLLKRDLDAVVAAVATADDYDGLRRALRTTFAEMNPAALAEVTERALVLAELGGRLAIRGDR